MAATLLETQTANTVESAWSYDEAFGRNLGLITRSEQETLRTSRVAIAGMGGVGGLHLVTLARLGIGQFTIADPDTFEVANTNRQYGATSSTCGHPKVEVMASVLHDINPDADLRVFAEPVGPDNLDRFLDGANVVVDGVDLYAIQARRQLFRAAAERGLWAITAGPVGYSAAWLAFAPDGMSFDRYFDLSDGMDDVEQKLAFLVGSSPKATQLAYMDLAYMNFEKRIAPSTSLACHLAAGVMGAEVLKVLLNRGRLRPAPYYQQFDAYLGRFVRRRLPNGNRHPWQRIKRWWLYRQYRLGKACWAGGTVKPTDDGR